MAELARSDMLPRKVHIVEGDIRALRELLSARHTLQSKRVALINTLRGYVLQEGTKLPEKFFARKDWSMALKKRRFSPTLEYIIESFMLSIEALQCSEKALTEKIEHIEDERLKYIESIPSVGKLTSRAVLSAIDNAERFDNVKAISNYGALAPTIYQSGNKTHMGHINYDGRHEVRRVLLQCAHTVIRMKSHAAQPFIAFYQRIWRKGGYKPEAKKKAIVAVARKLLTTIYGVLKHQAFYDPEKLLPEKVSKPGRTYHLVAA
jgi:transposase